MWSGNPPKLHSLLACVGVSRSLPSSIGRLTGLVTFDMSYNQLESIPEEIGECRQLSTLDLQHNKLANLPESIGNLKHLTRIGLR